MAKCQHSPRGIVTNQPSEYDPTRPHASISTCERPTCIAASVKWVAGKTNETATFRPFGSAVTA